jgi:hypothetical protein
VWVNLLDAYGRLLIEAVRGKPMAITGWRLNLSMIGALPVERQSRSETKIL